MTNIKTSKDIVLKTQKMTKESVKVSKRARQLAKETAKSTIKGIRMAIKAIISAIKGYYLAIEVKGATPVNQHWVTITGVNGNNVNIVDPGSNGTDLWSSYECSKSSQFNYFMVN